MKRIIVCLYSFFAGLSPRFEVALRRLYWSNSTWLKRFRPHDSKKINSLNKGIHVDFDAIIDFLRSKGVGDGTLLVVHSSYDVLENCTGLSPEEIIDKLIALIGPNGTLAMPAIRSFRGEPKYDEILTKSTDDLICKYNVRKTMVTSGMLPYTLLHREGSEVSHHPLNPLVAIGPLAKPMMEHNLDGDSPSPHGPNSSWKFCYDHDAVVIGLGADLDHYNTIAHVAEEAFGNWLWSDEEWYRLRRFIVIDEEKNSNDIIVKERKPCWGMLHSAETAANRFYYRHHLREKAIIGGAVLVCVQPAKPFIDALQDLCKRGKSFYY